MAKNRIPIWLALIVGAIGLPLAAILGLWTYKSVTTPILHTDPQQVRSVTHSHPSRKWTDAWSASDNHGAGLIHDLRLSVAMASW